MTTSGISIAAHFSDARQQRESAAFGMWLFLLTEIMLFGALFTAYAIYRWMYPDSFAAGSHHLDIWLGTANTAILIGSSLTMALAHRAAARDRRGPLVALLATTTILGAIFLGIKSFEYAHKFEQRLVPGSSFAWNTELADGERVGNPAGANPRHVELFFGLYFVMTGVHALHMLIGLGVMLVLIALAVLGRRSETAVEMTGLYWHFVDIVWIFLFPLLYLIGRHA